MYTGVLAPLDHYYLRLDDGSFAVVVGNWHFPHCLVGYVKYSPTSKTAIWSDKFTNYERLVKLYTPDYVYGSTSWFTQVPFFGGHVPCIPISKITHVYNPVERAIQLHHMVRDCLEELALDIISSIEESTGVTPGVTGSLLPGIHSARFSDVDLVVYGHRDSQRVLEFVELNKDLYQPLTGGLLAEWSERVAHTTGLTKHEVLKYYRNWRRGVYKGRMYSLIYNDGIYRCLFTMPAYRNMGIVKATVKVSGGLHALNYPSIGVIESYRIVESREKPVYDIEYIMSYESLYIPALYEGGSLELEGLLQCSVVDEKCRIMVGSREHRGTMKWLDGRVC